MVTSLRSFILMFCINHVRTDDKINGHLRIATFFVICSLLTYSTFKLNNHIDFTFDYLFNNTESIGSSASYAAH